MKEIVIFCQAPADIQYALSIYDKYQGNRTVHFFVIQVKGIYKFLTELKLKNAQVKFIPYPNLKIKNPKSIIKVRQYIKTNIKRYFRYMTEREIYYFSNSYDWLTFAFIANIAKRNTVFCHDHYAKAIPCKKESPLSIKDLLIILIYFYLTRVFLHYQRVNNRGIMSFNPDRYGVSEIDIPVSKDGYIKYAYHIESNRLRKNILFYESDLSNYKMISSYNETLEEIIDCFTEAGFTIYIKPHPRLGYSNILKECDVQVLPQHVPGEFISHEGFSAIVGIETVAIAKIVHISDIPVYSLMDLFEFRNEKVKNSYKEYLMHQSEGKLKFVSSLDDLMVLQ